MNYGEYRSHMESNAPDKHARALRVISKLSQDEQRSAKRDWFRRADMRAVYAQLSDVNSLRALGPEFIFDTINMEEGKRNWEFGLLKEGSDGRPCMALELLLCDEDMPGMAECRRKWLVGMLDCALECYDRYAKIAAMVHGGIRRREPFDRAQLLADYDVEWAFDRPYPEGDAWGHKIWQWTWGLYEEYRRPRISEARANNYVASLIRARLLEVLSAGRTPLNAMLPVEAGRPRGGPIMVWEDIISYVTTCVGHLDAAEALLNADGDLIDLIPQMEQDQDAAGNNLLAALTETSGFKTMDSIRRLSVSDRAPQVKGLVDMAFDAQSKASTKRAEIKYGQDLFEILMHNVRDTEYKL